MTKKRKKLRHLPGLKKRAPKIGPLYGLTSTQKTLREAMALQQAGHLSQAEPLYSQILQAEPDNVDAYINLGIILKIQGRTGCGG